MLSTFSVENFQSPYLAIAHIFVCGVANEVM